MNELRSNDHVTNSTGRRILRALAIAAALVIVVGVILSQRATTPEAPDGPTSSGIVPVPASPSAPANTATPTPEPTEPESVFGEEPPPSPETAAQDAAESAALAYVYYDNREDPERRQARLRELFTPGATVLDSAPMMTGPDGYEFITEGRVRVAKPLEVTDDSVEYLLTVEWGAASWPSEGGPTEAISGQRDLVVVVREIGGRWIATDLTSLSP